MIVSDKLLAKFHGNRQETNLSHRRTLMCALASGCVDMMRILLVHGANSNAVECFEEDAFWEQEADFDEYASRHELSFTYGALTRRKPATLRAAEMGRTDMLRMLLDHGADKDFVDSEQRDALMYASIGGSADAICFLFEIGADLKAVDSAGNTALLHAARSGQTVEPWPRLGSTIRRMHCACC